MNNKQLLAAGAVALSASFFSTTVTAATENGTATAVVLTPLSIVQTTQMNFGDVAGDADNATTVTLASGGGTTASAGANAAGSPVPGGFTVTGSGSLAYDITFPTPSSLTGAGTAMVVDTFETSVGTTSSLSKGSDSFTVGAVLHVNANQTSGTYNGTYDVTVQYQ